MFATCLIEYLWNSWALNEVPCIAGKLVGLLSIADVVKPDASEVVDTLNDMGLQVVLLTGDNERTAKAIADEV